MTAEDTKRINVYETDYWKIKELSARQKQKVPEFIRKLLNDFEVHDI